MDPDFQELSNDADLISRIKKFREASEKIEEVMTLAADADFYEQLSNEDKIKFNMLMSFGMNSMFWMYLRAEGIDPNTHRIKSENDRLKKAMLRAQEIKDKKTKMPRLDKKVAQRFVRSGLWDPNIKTNDTVQNQLENWDEDSSTNPKQTKAPK